MAESNLSTCHLSCFNKETSLNKVAYTQGPHLSEAALNPVTTTKTTTKWQLFPTCRSAERRVSPGSTSYQQNEKKILHRSPLNVASVKNSDPSQDCRAMLSAPSTALLGKVCARDDSEDLEVAFYDWSRCIDAAPTITSFLTSDDGAYILVYFHENACLI